MLHNYMMDTMATANVMALGIMENWDSKFLVPTKTFVALIL